jgi:hypothetical protein
MYASVRRILLDDLGDGGDAVDHVTTEVDDDLLEVLASDVMPERQLSDPSKAVDPKYGAFVLEDFDFTHGDTSCM